MEELEIGASRQRKADSKMMKKYAGVYNFVKDANPSNVELLELLSLEVQILASQVQSGVKDCIPLSSHRSLCLRDKVPNAPYSANRELQPSRFNKKRDGRIAFNQLTSAFYRKKRLYSNRQPVWNGLDWDRKYFNIIGHSDLETIHEDEELYHVAKRQSITPDALLRFATRRP